jgi:hypothetical protein
MEHAKKIVNLLGRLPLAVDIAGSYIENTQCEFRKYYKDQLGGNSGKFSSTVWKDEALSYNDISATSKHTLENVWQAPFKGLHKDAQKLLRLISFLGSEDIPMQMVERGQEEVHLNGMLDFE